VVAAAKARQLEASGYQVRITDRRGRQFTPSEFDELFHSKPRASARDFIPAAMERESRPREDLKLS